ncbi:MAG: hypothetical protein COA58_11020 [Bacteroidetes bacterium]|nr:MAG: hypothetical protein COA58_11020 [Bacteroidota bacterium]
MIIELKKHTLLSIFLVFTISGLAQNGTYHTVRDFETWTSATFNYKVNKKIKLSLNEQLRLKDNSSTVDAYFTQLSLKYNFTKKLSLGIGARYIRDNDDKGKIQGYENHLRWQADLEYKHKISRFTMKYRTRYQNKDELGITTDSAKTNFRLKLASTYNIKNWKFDPTVSTEIFNGLSNDEGLNKIRFTLGTKYRTKHVGDFGLFYRMEKGLIGDSPKTTNIIGFKYDYTFKREKKDKEKSI